MNELITGWKAAIKMASEKAAWYVSFNDENQFDIHEKKKREMPANLKELDKLLWLAYRAAQAETSKSILGSIQIEDWTRYLEDLS